MLLRHLLVEVAIVLQNATHGNIEFLFQIGAIPVYAEEEIRRAHLAYGHHVCGITVGVERYQRVDVSALEHGQQLGRLGRQLHNFRGHPVTARPLHEKLLLDAVLVHAHPLAVEGGEIIWPDVGVGGRDESVIVLGAHLLGRE